MTHGLQNLAIIDSLVEEEGVKRVDLSGLGFIGPEILNLIPEDISLKYKVIAFDRHDDVVAVAMANPFDILALEAVRSRTRLRPDVHFAPAAQIEEWLTKIHVSSNFSDEADEAGGVGLLPENELTDEDINLERLTSHVQDAPAIHYVNSILMQAIQERASDIHVEPQERALRVRFRIDGALRDVATPPRKLSNGIISRIKILASLDIAERRMPQDGRSKLNIFGRSVDFRVSTLPSIYGEKVVMRILDKDSHSLEVRDLGFEEQHQKRFIQALAEPHGLILATGPTGSGKTTTLYSALNHTNDVVKNIVTIEDPVEYRLRGITQVQAKPQIGLTFAAGLRAILRQDPDVIMVGEIRDLETAEIAMRAALTGHLVLSTLHTNNSIDTIMRLIDMGIDKHMICASVILCMAQRLVRRICFHCIEDHKLQPAQFERFGHLLQAHSDHTFAKGKGCAKCGGTGYWGRLAIFEFFYLNHELRNMILADEPIDRIKQAATKMGMETLFMNGMRKATAGITTVDEILRVNSDMS